MTAITTIGNTQQPAWQAHKYADSTDSEISYFEPSTTSTCDSWTGYFEGWQGDSQDHFCPQIASQNNSPSRTKENQHDQSLVEEDLLPTACSRRQRPTSVRMEGSYLSPITRPAKKKRFGIVPHADSYTGNEAIARLNGLLQSSMSNTEDILAAMYNSEWDISSLQKWYEQSSRTPSDLALFKIMFSLRYTPDEERHSI
ncbi:hypothetical protein H2198_007282 [Neophaeococcomyces mojaviensis]|uniref:Uncharacterized protein n=1 Tax=Neophaeococcomyces mojaviensis TaxID=3383035 RepID=A0ACC3A0J8_9EURO|nr:hypothetical protein H2198_007282 [Knufia sp. JES_112]